MPFAKSKEKDDASAPSTPRPKMDTEILTISQMFEWVLPPFQRDEVQTKKVIEFAEELKINGGMIGGVIHLGVLRGQNGDVYLVDGQQRRNACQMSGLTQFIADTSLKSYASMVDMAEDFQKLNSRLVPMRPDDLLRSYEISHPIMKKLRENCPFVGYSNVRRNEDRDPILSMSAVLKCWFGSGAPTPGHQGQAVTLVDQMDENQCQMLTVFLLSAHSAWGSDRQYYRLWANLNLMMCMYLYRKLVLEPGNRRAPVPQDIFRKCLMSVSADSNYSDWLQGRNIGERDRAPCYKRVKSIFANRLSKEYNGKIIKLPQPEWAH